MLSARHFGLLIAYVIPGFVLLVGLSGSVETVRQWLGGPGATGPNVGSFLYVLLASVALGLTASTLRWTLLDTIHHATGLHRPRLDFAALPGRLDAFERVVEDHYSYYKFYGNSLIALLAAYLMWRADGGGSYSTDVVWIVIECVFAAGSRDALRRYYQRASRLLGVESEVPHDERIRPPRDEVGGHGQEQSDEGHGEASGGGDGEADAPQGERQEVTSVDKG